MTSRWVIVGNTHMMFVRHDYHLQTEWHPAAQITLRQVYDVQEPTWYVWLFIGDSRVEASKPFSTSEEAIKYVKARLQVA
jgi:hypothetical protein